MASSITRSRAVVEGTDDEHADDAARRRTVGSTSLADVNPVSAGRALEPLGADDDLLREMLGDNGPSVRLEHRRMPKISHFFGIVVTMYYTDHSRPHFHAKYGGQRISVAIEDARVLSGDFPGRARKMVLDWLELHRDELTADWKLAQERKPLKKIDPLE